MIDISKYCNEFINQPLTDAFGTNYTSYAIMLFIKNNDFYFCKKRINDLYKFVFRFYVDNCAHIEKNKIVLSKFTNRDYISIKEHIDTILSIWIKFGKDVLQIKDDYLNINSLYIEISKDDKQLLLEVIKAISNKIFGKIIFYDNKIDESINRINVDKLNFESYCNLINNTNFFKNVYEEIDYCVCCDECDKTKLQPTHIDFHNHLDNPNNSYMFCKEHARMYYENKFIFDKRGRIIIKKQESKLDKRMHLDMEIVKNKKEFL